MGILAGDTSKKANRYHRKHDKQWNRYRKRLMRRIPRYAKYLKQEMDLNLKRNHYDLHFKYSARLSIDGRYKIVLAPDIHETLGNMTDEIAPLEDRREFERQFMSSLKHAISTRYNEPEDNFVLDIRYSSPSTMYCIDIILKLTDETLHREVIGK